MGAAKMSEFLRERKGACSPFNMALGRATKIWDLYDEPGNTWRGRRFRAAMAGGTSGFPSSLFTDGKCSRPILSTRMLLTYVRFSSRLEVS